MADLFISYSHVDGYFVDHMKEHLLLRGYSSWIDCEDIRGGRDWRSQIDHAIQNSFALIVVLSPDSTKSEYVIYEWSFALSIGIVVIPLLLRDIERRPPRLDILEDINFTDRYRKYLPWDELFTALDSAKTVYEERLKAKQAVSADLVQQLTEQLDNGDHILRRSLATVLGLIANPVAETGLLKHIFDENPDVQVAVIRALGTLKSASAVSLIITLLDHKVYSVRLACTDALEEIGEPAVGLLSELALNKDAPKRKGISRSRINAIIVLGRIGNEDAIATLLNAVKDEDLAVVAVAVNALGDMRVLDAIPILVPFLSNREKVWWFAGKRRLDEIAAQALFTIGTEESKAATKAWLRDQEWVSKKHFPYDDL